MHTKFENLSPKEKDTLQKYILMIENGEPFSKEEILDFVRFRDVDENLDPKLHEDTSRAYFILDEDTGYGIQFKEHWVTDEQPFRFTIVNHDVKAFRTDFVKIDSSVFKKVYNEIEQLN